MSKIRTFIAIDLPARNKKRIESLIGRESKKSKLSFVDASQLHLTLNFIGDVEDTLLPTLCKRIAHQAQKFETFSILLNGFGAFPNMERPRVFWLGIDEGNDELKAMNLAFRRVIEDLGFLQEQKYQPHLTLARNKIGTVPSDLIDEFQNGVKRMVFDPWTVEKIVIYSSTLERRGPIHVPVSTIELS